MESLLQGDVILNVSHLVGVHGDGVTWILRLMGAKCGQRIYWPGSGLEGIVEFDLLEVGDDVVFGSRSMIMTCDSEDAAPVRIEAGAFVGDRCVLQPGFTIKRNALLGTGGLGAKNVTLSAGSKWVGSRKGNAVQLEAGSEAQARADTIRPFGRAMYLGQANYFVLPWYCHGLFSTFIRCANAMFGAAPVILSFIGTSYMLAPDATIPKGVTFVEIAQYMIPIFLCIQNTATMGALFIAWALKWLMIGRRRVGEYDWDTSDYSQRWQFYLTASSIIRMLPRISYSMNGHGLLEHLSGSAYLVWWFRAHGSYIGKNVCLYPRAAHPMMTEPELVQIGDGASIDVASVIAHINTQGSFSLHQTVVGPEATLRSWSRLLAGAAVMPRGQLLEHTLVLGGDVVDEDCVWQGWPGEVRGKVHSGLGPREDVVRTSQLRRSLQKDGTTMPSDCSTS